MKGLLSILDVAMPTPYEEFMMKYGTVAISVVAAIIIAVVIIVIIKIINKKKSEVI